MRSRITFYRFFCVLLVARSSCTSVSCPPAGSIAPCKCWVNPKTAELLVRCDDVSNLASVRGILEEQLSQQPLNLLKIKGVNSFSLPPRALGNLTPVRFMLRDSNIRHIDDDAFVGQESLELLSMNNDRLQDIPAAALRLLSRVQTLGLAANFLMRVEEGSLNHLSSLRFLILTGNRISKIDKHAFPKYLTVLSLSGNLLTTFNQSLQQLHRLEELSASDNRLTSVRGEFNGFSQLKRLYLDRNQLSEISNDFADLKSLEDLRLSGNRIQDVGKSLTGLVKLRLLNLSHNYISELHWRMFEKLKDLEVLDISANYLKTVCPVLKPLKSLRDLNLSDLNLKNLDLDCFHSMKSLTRLDLSHNHLTNVDAVSRYPLRSLAHLRLDHNRLTTLSYDLNYAKNLRQLDISFNNFSIFNTHYLAYNKELAILNMGDNPWQCTEPMLLMLRDMEERKVQVQGRPDC